MRFRLLVFGLMVFSNLASASYATDYYEKYNPKVPKLANTPLAQHRPFIIQSGQLYADGGVFTLQKAADIQLTPKALKAYDLETVIIQIGGKPYKATPQFKKLTFMQKGQKGVFGYTLGRELTLVYVPYQDKIRVLGVISQGQYIQENRYQTYDINVAHTAKKQVFKQMLKLLGCHQVEDCQVKSDSAGNSYFYLHGQLMAVLQDFGPEKILIQKRRDGERRLATLRQYGQKILLEDQAGHILYKSLGQQTLDIRLEALNYRMRLKITNP